MDVFNNESLNMFDCIIVIWYCIMVVLLELVVEIMVVVGDFLFVFVKFVLKRVLLECE